MKAAETKASKLFESGYQLQVPVWQRAYSWRESQWGELWADISRLRRQPINVTHFLGSVVVRVHPWSGLPASAQIFSVVDGQQRVTTLTLFLLAVRESLRNHGNGQEADRLTPQLFDNTNKTASDIPRLVLQEDDQRSLRHIVERTDVPAGNVGECFSYFLNQLRAESDEGLFELIQLIQTRLDLVWISLEETDNHHRVFQTINAGGRPLRQTDLVRNFFFLLLASKGNEFYTQHWSKLESSLKDKHLENFFSAWSITKGHSGANDKLFSFFNQDLTTAGGSSVAVWEYGIELVKFAKIYSVILGLNQARDSDAAVERELQWLRNWGTKPAEGLILLLFKLREEKRLNSDGLAECLAIIFSFFARRFIAGYEPNLHRSILVGVTKSFLKNENFKGKELVHYLRALLSIGSELKKWPSDEYVIEQAVTTQLYTNTRNRWVKAILGKVNDVIVSNPKLSGEPDEYFKYEVEHIMPQTLTEEWKCDLKTWGVKDPQDFHQKRLHVLGNLTLSKINASLSNNRFDEKVAQAKHDTLRINTLLQTTAEWTDSRVDERSRRLARDLISALPRPLSATEIGADKFVLESLDLNNPPLDENEDDA
jgi:hypothetical protein